MELTNEELRIAFEELKHRMGLMGNMGASPFIMNKEYSREELITLLKHAQKLIQPGDGRATKSTMTILKYIKSIN